MDGTLDYVEKVVGMEEGESDYSVVHLGPETQGLPAFHRIVGEDEVNSPVFPVFGPLMTENCLWHS